MVTSTTANPLHPGLKYRIFAAFGLQQTELFYAASQRYRTISTKGFRFEWFSGDPFTVAQLSEEGGVGLYQGELAVAAQVRKLLVFPQTSKIFVEN